MSDIIDTQTSDERAEGLKAWGWVSYVLHLIVAVGAVIPGAQPGAALLIVALVIDLVKPLEYLSQLLGRDAGTIITHDDTNAAGGRGRRIIGIAGLHQHIDPTRCFGAEFHSIGQ